MVGIVYKTPKCPKYIHFVHIRILSSTSYIFIVSGEHTQWEPLLTNNRTHCKKMLNNRHNEKINSTINHFQHIPSQINSSTKNKLNKEKKVSSARQQHFYSVHEDQLKFFPKFWHRVFSLLCKKDYLLKAFWGE